MRFKFSYIKLKILFPIIIFLIFIISSSLLTPLLMSSGMTGLYKSLNFFNSLICHQYPQRCYFIFDYNIGLCARCFSFYVAMLILIIIYLFTDIAIEKRLRTPIFFLLITPLITDGITQFLKFRESTNLIRTITGVMGGFGVAIILIPSYFKTVLPIYKKFGRKNNGLFKELYFIIFNIFIYATFFGI